MDPSCADSPRYLQYLVQTQEPENFPIDMELLTGLQGIHQQLRPI